MEKLTNVFKIEYTKGDTYALAVKLNNITEELRYAFFTVKDNPDEAPLIQKTLNNGIAKIDDRTYKNEKTFKLQLQPADTINLEAQHQYLYDIQVTIGNVVKTVLHGVFVLRNTVTGTAEEITQAVEVKVDDEVKTEMLKTVSTTNAIEQELDPVASAKIGDLTPNETVVQEVNKVANKVSLTNSKLNNILNGTTQILSATTVQYASEVNSVKTAEMVKKAQNADYAEVARSVNSVNYADEATNITYASADTSKGTIEERINNIIKTIKEKTTFTYDTDSTFNHDIDMPEYEYSQDFTLSHNKSNKFTYELVSAQVVENGAFLDSAIFTTRVLNGTTYKVNVQKPLSQQNFKLAGKTVKIRGTFRLIIPV